MINFSNNGMCFESDTQIGLNKDICIKMVEPLEKNSEFGGYTFFRAKTKWCKNLNGRHKDPTFETGVQYLSRCKSESGKVYHCALSGDAIDPEKIRQLDDHIYMQKECYDQYCELPDGRLKKELKEYMIGNVL
jgi:hypothetical protein